MTRPTMIVAGMLLIFAAIAMGALRSCQTATTESKLATGQRDAATASGQDAVETVGAAAAREQDIRVKVEVGSNAIRQAPAGDSNDAAVRAACGMRSYRGSEQCVELLGPAPDRVD